MFMCLIRHNQGAPLTYISDRGVQGIFLAMKFWPKGIFWVYERRRNFFGSRKKQGFFWILYFSSAQINNNTSVIYYWCGISLGMLKKETIVCIFDLNPRRHKVKKVTRRHKGGGGGQSDPSPLLLTPFIRLTRYLAHIMSVLCTFN